MLSPNMVLNTFQEVLDDTSPSVYTATIRAYMEKEIPHKPVYVRSGAVLLNPYSPEKLAALPLEERFDADYLVTNHQYNAIIMFCLQLCAGCEAYLKSCLDWVLTSNPKLMKKKEKELTLSLSTAVDASDLSEVLANVRQAVVALVVKGKGWSEKLKSFCKFLDIPIPQDHEMESLDKMFFLRNSLSHEENPKKLDFSFIDPSLTIARASTISEFQSTIAKLISFAEAMKTSLYKLDQSVGYKHLHT